MMKKDEAIDAVIERLLAQPEPIPLLEAELKQIEQTVLTTEQHISGIEVRPYENQRSRSPPTPTHLS